MSTLQTFRFGKDLDITPDGKKVEVVECHKVRPFDLDLLFYPLIITPAWARIAIVPAHVPTGAASAPGRFLLRFSKLNGEVGV